MFMDGECRAGRGRLCAAERRAARSRAADGAAEPFSGLGDHLVMAMSACDGVLSSERWSDNSPVA